MRVFTIGHGTRESSELVTTLQEAGAQVLVDVRRFPGSRRNPQFNQGAVASALRDAGIGYRHALELGGRRRNEPGEEWFGCIRTQAFRSYAARMGQREWQLALREALTEPAPCFMCAESDWRRCHRRLIADLLTARAVEIVHLLRPGEHEPHQLFPQAEVRDGTLYLCGEVVA